MIKKTKNRFIISKCVFTFFIFVFLITLLSIQSNKTYQENSLQKLEKLRKDVLEKNIIGKTFEFDLTGQKDCNKTKLTYLGIVNTKKGKQYKLITSFCNWFFL